MTDFSASDDELLSSFIDGDLTGDDLSRLDARLAADAGLQARLTELRGAAELAATTVSPLPPDQVDDLIAAALAASATAANVTDLGAARSARARWLPKVAAAAAGVALVAVAIPTIASLDSGDDSSVALDAATQPTDDADTSADPGDAGDADGDDMADTAEPTEAALDMDDAAPTDTTFDAASVDGADDGDSADAPTVEEFASSFSEVFGNDALESELGAFASGGELRAAVEDDYLRYRAGLNAEPVEPSDGSDVTGTLARQVESGLANCMDLLFELEDRHAPVLAVDYSTAEVGSMTTAIVLYGLEDGAAVAYVIDPGGCMEIDQVELDGAG